MDLLKMWTKNEYIVATAAVVGASIFVVAWRDYRAYIALGPHGLPDTFGGWVKQLKMCRKARKDITVPAPYDFDVVKEAYGPYATTSFLNKRLSPRVGPRPTIPGFVAPQRQTSDRATESMKSRMNAYLAHLAVANPDTLQSELSVLEGPVPALQLAKAVTRPNFLRPTKGEMVHIHPPDGSTHLVLSLSDSKSIIENGWGQRHRLSGGGLLGWNYTLIYAPRSDDEFRVWKDAVNAAVQYCCADISKVSLEG